MFSSFTKNCVLIQVRHSQRLNEKALDVWLIVDTDGSILTGHCTCMAGTSETCSHVGAILYAVEHAYRTSEELSVTDVKALWPVPSTSKVVNVPVVQMDWGKKSVEKGKRKAVPSLQGDNLKSFTSNLKSAGCNPALMRVLEPFATELQKNVHRIQNIFSIYKEKYNALSLEDLHLLGNKQTFCISEEDICHIEENSRGQAQSGEWYRQRSGRITASCFKAACRTSVEKPSLTVIKSVCYPTKVLFSTNATRWGINHEDTAAQAYFQDYTASHDNPEMSLSGLVISKTYPQLGASPDRLICCSCCGTGCVEIKCPYVLQQENLTISDFTERKNSYLEENAGQITIKKNHAYFYQVQLQMYVTKRKFCDFVVWSPKEMFIERIKIDEAFLQVNIEKALDFHQKVIVPELLGRFYTRSLNHKIEVLWCLCQKPDTGEPMLQCENDECSIQWFHLSCIKLNDVPESFWMCPNCIK